MTGTIERVSYTGDALSVAVRVGDQQLQAQMLTSSGDLPRIGDAAYLSWAPEDAYLLPAPTERLAA
jgi:putative spermidine/putrescine transport system ATP-binding protein